VAGPLPIQDLQGIFLFFQIPVNLLTAKKAKFPAKWDSEDLMTIPTHHLLPGIPGDRFGGTVEEKDPSLKIVGNDPFPQAVEDIGKVVYLFPHPSAFSLREYPGRRLQWSREILPSTFYMAVVFFHGRIGFTLLIIAPWPP
jgi:hypothetical protein